MANQVEPPKQALEEDQDTMATPVPLPKKKKRNRKPKSKKGRNKPTGFEEYYVDTPMTVAEHEEELNIYNVSRPIIHRIEDALLRFHQKRRIETNRQAVFLKYLAYGGINVGPNSFAGTDNREMKQMDSDQILLVRGQTSISKENSHLPIDFNAVVKGFLTSDFPFSFNPESEEMVKLATVTIRSFLSYLLYHDVCPEYKDNIDQARNSCDIATKELWKNQQLMASGPGDFNKACTILFGGLEYDNYAEDTTWRNLKHDGVYMTKDIARKVMKFGLAIAGSDHSVSSFVSLDDGKLKATRLEDIDGFEVTKVRLLDEGSRKAYQDHAPDLHPVGVLHAKAYCDPAMPEYDLSPEERDQWAKEGRPIEGKELVFYLEENLLEHCYPGMKIISPVWEVTPEFYYFEDVQRAYSSIYTVLPNDMMIRWKKPRSLTASEKDQGSDEESDLE